MAKVVPAILPHTVDEYKEGIRLVRRMTQRYQLDIIDPEFANNATVELSELELRTDMVCDFHIMSPDPLKYMPIILKIQPNLLILQCEALIDPDPAEVVDKLAQKGLRVGLAINPDTPVDGIKQLLPSLEHVLVMGCPAGFAGQKFQPRVLSKVTELRQLAPTIEIGLDGGVSGDSIGKIAKAGFDVVNANTYLFSASDPLDRYSDMMEELA